MCQKNIDGQNEKLHDDVETVTHFSYQGDRINSVGGSEAAVTPTTRLGWVRFSEYEDLPRGKNYLWKRDMVLRPNEIGVLQ